MEKERSSKMIAIAALLVAVIGLSIGFAGLTRTLTISSSANVTPDNNMKVYFSTDSETLVAGEVDVDITGTDEDETTTDPSAATATIASTTSTTLSGLKANFTRPGQTVKYTFYAHNVGSFDAYLTTITFENVVGEGITKKCNPKSGTTASYANAACEDITINVTVGEGEKIIDTNGPMPNISGHPLTMTNSEKITVTISYPEGSDVSDGDFDVVFGNITLTYDSVDSPTGA